MLLYIKPIVIHSVNLGHTNSKHITHTHTYTHAYMYIKNTRAKATNFTCVWYLAWYPRHTHTHSHTHTLTTNTHEVVVLYQVVVHHSSLVGVCKSFEAKEVLCSYASIVNKSIDV